MEKLVYTDKKNIEKEGHTKMNDVNVLIKNAIDSGIIDLETVQAQLNMQMRTTILNEHGKSIWQGRTTGHWFTYLPDEKNGRVQKERHTRKEIEDLIVAFYWPTEEEESKNPETLEELFPEWFEYKATTGVADSYLRKINDMWKAYYQDDPIVKKKLSEFDRFELEKWAHTLIEKHDMNKKPYYNVTCIIRQSLDYAVQKGYIAKNPFVEFTMNAKYFRKDEKKPDDTQVFLTDEQPKIEKACWDKFHARPMFTSPLAILLHFRMGISVGEMVALRESDIEGDYIHVQRYQATSYNRGVVDGKVDTFYKGTHFEEYAEDSVRNRFVPLTPEAKKIIELVLETNRTYGHHCKDYIFVNKNKVMGEASVIHKLYAVCEMAGIPKKSTHKIRKTFVSTLIDADVNINTIRKTFGHKTASTTLSAYVYDRHTDDELKVQFADALDRA